MPQIIDRLAALRVADVMAKDVVTVSKDQTMEEVACVLSQHRLSSAPVVDECGHCVGIITASDFLKRASHPVNSGSSHGEPQELAKDAPRYISTGEDFASVHMSRAVQAVDPGASLLKAARIMCAGHIHRLLAIDETNHPVGVISTMDIVAAMVNVVDEMNVELGRGES